MNEPATIEAKKEGFSTKEIVLYTMGGIILLGGGFFLARNIIHNAGEKQVEKKASQEDSPESFAKALKMAFENDGWPGTNMIEVRRVMQQIPSKDFLIKVQSKYQQRYHRPLFSDLSDELQSSEYKEMLSIIASKPEKRSSAGAKPVLNYPAWARRLKAAFDKTYGIFPGTDEAAIRAVFIEIPTQADFIKTAEAYQKEYHASLIADLKSELEFWEYGDYMKIITSKPKS